jgi:excisionase family DNA binding protein
MSDDLSQILKVKEVAAALKISRSHVYRMVEAGTIPCFRMGKRGQVRFREDALDRWMRELSK